MSKYGLQLRGAKPVAKPAVAKAVPSVFKEDDDDESVEREIARQAVNQRSIREAEKQQKKALEQDPSAFDYDGVYDNMKSSQVRPDRAVKREAKYIPRLIEKAKFREREHDIIYEKQLAKERSKEDHLYGGKEKYVTSAYKIKLAEQEKWLAEERMRAIKERDEEVTKRSDLSDFYRNLSRNVAFGGKLQDRRDKEKITTSVDENQTELHTDQRGAPSTTKEEVPEQSSSPKAVSAPVAGAPVAESPGTQENKQADTLDDAKQEDDSTQKQGIENRQQQEKSEEDSRKRKEDEARQRYLARKKSKNVT